MLTLKCVLFLLFGAVGSLLPFIPLHMNALDLSRDEAVIVSGIAPLIALIGPLVAAPLSDRLACGFGGAPRSKTDRYLRVMIGTCCVLATIFYWLLTLIPAIMRSPPHVSFMCDEAGGFILQDRCGAERTCYNWGSGKGSVLVKNCIFSCNATSAYKGESSTSPPVEEVSAEYGEDYYDAGTYIINEPEGVAPPQTPAEYIQEPYPHMCFKNASGSTICEVYTEYYSIKLNLGLLPSAPNQQNETDDTCKYPFAEPFACRMPSKKVEELKKEFGSDDCNPVVVCEILDPYNNTDSLLKRSQCGYDNISFWLYLFIKSFADIFIAAAVALIGTAVVIATRETSTGRGDIGKQFACGVAGFGLFAPIIGGCADGRFFEGIICFTVLMVLAVIILLADEKMPLSPPEWWWHHPLRPTGASDVFSQKVWTGNGSTGHHYFPSALICIENATLLFLCEFLEIFTLHVMYVTAVLYLRHLVPRKLTACGQALPVVAHFCLGRCIGAFLGGIAYDEYPANFNRVHQWFTVAAAVVAFIYYIAYHFYLKPKCGAPVHLPPDPAPAVVQSMNGNGSYTPLRVYHNSKSKKGHFRY
ncbi:hypothetical protein HUJ04_011568 [Dendroctonus ponderosae]|nr:hypothetical protein HUJ04_011568 [Dendroctonus ponderosae]